MSDYIEELRAVFLKLHGCKAKHIESVPVVEEYQGQIVWQGNVETFELTGHPKANTGYGWGHYVDDEGESRKYVTVLELPPIKSPQDAVKAVVAMEIKNAREKAKGG
jgi:hypothetical protein